jgi:ribonucleoside-diphosphate reductase alpha chain
MIMNNKMNNNETIKEEMRVIKRNGNYEIMSFDKILNRIRKIGLEAGITINYSSLTMKIIQQLFDCITTKQIDELTAEHCASLSVQHYDYGILASYICISNFQKNVVISLKDYAIQLYEIEKPFISKNMYDCIMTHHEILQSYIVFQRDYLIDYFGFKTIERSYLFRLHNKVCEPIQYMWMRVAIGIHGNNLPLVKETYDLMSQKYFIHATPTLFNAGTPRPQMSSCYLLGMEEDSIDGIYSTLSDCAKISKWAGGIGLHIHNIRAKGSHINGTNGSSSGIVPMLRVFNNTAKYVDQGGNKRPGSFAIYLEPWHPDVEDFLEMKKNHGDEESKARDLFYALWIPDLFMERVKSNSHWSLFCPSDCVQLSNVYGDEFSKLYHQYEEEKKARKVIPARELWMKIMDAQMETGTPYLLYKDAINHKSNQKNIGTIKSSNLCCEIMQYSDEKETAVCNLASIGLPTFVNSTTKEFDYDKLHSVVKVITLNLNNIIDLNYYPTNKTKVSNLKHRPIGIGVQGLADTFMLMNIAFHSEEAKQLNKLIFETIYHAALEKSYEISKQIYEDYLMTLFSETKIKETEEIKEIKETYMYQKRKGAYESFDGSPLSKGIFQFDMWDEKEELSSSRFDWNLLRLGIMEYGVRNSLLIAPMPTASTSQILGFNECFEPFTSNLYTRKTLAGDFIMVNKYLIHELIEMGQWNEDVKNNIIANKGSVLQLDFLSEEQKNKYKIVWEIPMQHVIDMAVDRGRYVCQSQSMNLWLENPTYKSLNNMHFYAWKKGLKTGIYYLRRKAKHQAQQFTIEPTMKKKLIEKQEKEKQEKQQEEQEEDSICEMCSA